MLNFKGSPKEKKFSEDLLDLSFATNLFGICPIEKVKNSLTDRTEGPKKSLIIYSTKRVKTGFQKKI